ncbi:MAG: hypothetical protein EZS28_036187 [Streblomastix strix]|uniref:Uncharacterized protein n=1 Tax=Streblomastix strix TaxID=222440 RepID=A0A5J4UCT6_9EUKA|nr:MAG: hypothetical protein EZS28_036187 [Streblomastix strix]
MSKNSVKPEPSEPGLFVNFDTPKFTAKTPVTTISKQSEFGDEVVKFLQSEQQSTLQNIQHWLTPRLAVSKRTQVLMAKVFEAMTSVQASEIDLLAKNILDEQNGEARRHEIQCKSLIPIMSMTVQKEVLDSKRSLIDKFLQSELALMLYNFRIGEGILVQICEQQHEQLAIDVLSLLINNLREAQRMHFAGS